MGAEDKYIVSLSSPLRVILSWRRVIVLLTFLLVGISVGSSLVQTPTYEASIRILVGEERASGAPGGDLQSVVLGLQQLTQTVAEDIKSRPVADAVIQRLSLPMTAEGFLNHVSVEQVPRTQLVEVHYSDPSPERAQQVANAIGEVYSEQVSELSPSANNTITATVREEAWVPVEPVSPNIVLNSVLALIAGLMLGIGVAFLAEYVNNGRLSAGERKQVGGTNPARDKKMEIEDEAVKR